MDQTNLEPLQPVQNSFFSAKNLLPLALFSTILIVLASSVTYFVLQSKQTSPLSVQPTVIPTQLVASSPSPIPDETANWKTYTNNQLKFTLKYPPYFLITEKPKSIYFSTSEAKKDNLEKCLNFYECYDIPFGIDFSEETKPANQSLTDFIKSKQADPTYYSSVSVDQKNALQNQSKSPAFGGFLNSTYIDKQNSIFYLFSQFKEEKNSGIYNQILSTFKFLDQYQTSDTSQWKTYSNENLGLTIKYPESLFLKESGQDVLFAFETLPTGDAPYPLDLILLAYGNWTEFDALFKAQQGEDVKEAHHAVDVKVEKIQNLTIAKFDAVEYIRDGTIPPTTGLGRGPIGYEHHYLIKKNDKEYINFINLGMDRQKTQQRDSLFRVMLSSLIIK
ncbi:hypothetical protein HYW87_02685 [Candidatus Roizmanbacteria bacterium]|nr:hypothetical protein [Candidatus Roizmanbacteria bacterium]